MNQKNCAIPTSPAIASGAGTDPAQATAQTQQPKEVKLAELKRLYDANLITKEIYVERQKVILESAMN